MSLACEEEIKLVAIIKEASTKMYAVFYACVYDTEDDGIFVDSTYFGGTTITKTAAEVLMRDINNDKSIQGGRFTLAIIPKILTIDGSELEVAYNVAQRYFNNMARDMYAKEEMDKKGKSK